jgi:hypothetical protein
MADDTPVTDAVTTKGATLGMHSVLLLRQVLFAVSVIVAFIAIARTFNMHDIIAFVATDDFMKMAGVVGSVGFPLYSQIKTRLEREKLVTVLDRVPDSIGKVVK